jgi:1-aminocyclopropane-1-carboxylate deaminase/D-cysteine desulfhydrase-like pyridoxal-dependent ACC family enzyme
MMWQALYPVVARSFGSAPKAVLKYAHAFAETEDILLHPLYSAKMMMTLEQAPHDEGTIAVLSGGGSVLLDYPKP